MLSRTFVGATLLLRAISAIAGIEFELTDGQRELRGGEICFYHSAVATGNVAPDKYYFSGDEVRCFPSNTILDMPAGRFLMFARHPDGYVSANRLMRYDAVPTSQECYQALRVHLRPAAFIDVSATAVGDDARIGVWIDDTDKTLSTFIPLVFGESSIAVPAGITVVPVEVRGKQLKRIGNPLVLRPGERYELRRWPAKEGHGDVVAWMEGEDETVRELTRKGRSPRDIEVTLTASNGETFRSVTTPRHPGSYTGTLLVFKDVPAGKARLASEGQFWTRDTIEVKVPDAGLVMPGRGLKVLPASLVHVTLPVGVASGTTSGTCEQRGPGEWSAILRRHGDQSEAPVRESVFEPATDGIDLPGVPAGEYQLEIRPPHGRRWLHRVTAVAGEEVSVNVQDVGSLIYGTVRRGNRGVKAQLQFATDDTIVSDDAGRFRALLKADPSLNPVAITLCEGGRFTHLPERPPTPYEAFDIDLPDNAVIAAVRDAVTGRAVTGSRLRFAVLRDPDDTNPDSFAILYSQAADADERGEARFDGIAAERVARVCASAAGYKPSCSDRLVTPKRGERRVEVKLQPVHSINGRVTAAAPLEHARIFLLSATGHLLAEANIERDGMFSCEVVSAAAHAAVIAPALPLTLVRVSTPPPGNLLEIALPQARARRFQVVVRRPRNVRLGIMIGGVVVPSRVFSLHQNFHGLQSVLMNGGPLEVADIAETAPIAIVLGHDPDDVSFPADAASRPEYVPGLPARMLPADSDVVVFQ